MFERPCQATSTSARAGGNAYKITLHNLMDGVGSPEVRADGENFLDLPRKLYSKCL